ncbi:MAG: tRNA pseudouridine(38-40) synthase TruA [Lewinellaceae bacterium]|nr:tRNA pseudouridine(38-40) synthase TruA [Lewinellaceae bacterium]
MRYFLQLSYLGTGFSGWQRQPNALAVQEKLEDALATLLREPISVTGCGRTDTGVHARYYIAHFDAGHALPERFLEAINSMLPSGIAVQRVIPVPPDAHARFDAVERSYVYTITLVKDPFLTDTAWYYPQGKQLDLDAVHKVATLLGQYEDFAPFCKSDSGLDHFRCQSLKAHWEVRGELLEFHISANRFLRGMVRLVVGSCVYAGLGKMSVAEIKKALEEQSALPMPFSVPAQGLALTAVRYPYPIGSAAGIHDDAQLDF